mmetsp:Transcript_7943/g.21755  ORF Transcript_7943/g.21755 Transcript_7943/m.21755 type:complete len:320 (-) Transcript_7943:866-1825(-)
MFGLSQHNQGAQDKRHQQSSWRRGTNNKRTGCASVEAPVLAPLTVRQAPQALVAEVVLRADGEPAGLALLQEAKETPLRRPEHLEVVLGQCTGPTDLGRGHLERRLQVQRRHGGLVSLVEPVEHGLACPVRAYWQRVEVSRGQAQGAHLRQVVELVEGSLLQARCPLVAVSLHHVWVTRLALGNYHRAHLVLSVALAEKRFRHEFALPRLKLHYLHIAKAAIEALRASWPTPIHPVERVQRASRAPGAVVERGGVPDGVSDGALCVLEEAADLRYEPLRVCLVHLTRHALGRDERMPRDAWTLRGEAQHRCIIQCQRWS